MSEIIMWGAVIVWIIGFIAHLAFVNANKHLVKDREQPPFWILALVVFVTWPYLFFTGKLGKKNGPGD